MRIKDKDMEKIILNPEDYKNAIPIVKVGTRYKDLYEQTFCQNKESEQLKNRLFEVVKKMKDEQGSHNVNLLIEQMYSCIDSEVDYCEGGNISEMSTSTVREATNKMYSMQVIAIHLNDLLSICSHLEELENEMKLTQKLILI